MKYLVFLLIFVVSFSVLSMKTNTIERWEPGEFSYEDSVFYEGQTKTLYVIFDYNGGHVLEESKPMLDSMANFLLKNMNLNIKIANYNDTRGNDDYNLKLTQMRANKVMEYLISKNIDKDRLTAIGKGETNLLYDDSFLKNKTKSMEESESLRVKNRRTVFMITPTFYQKK